MRTVCELVCSNCTFLKHRAHITELKHFRNLHLYAPTNLFLSFFVSFFLILDLCLPTNCRCRGYVALDHTPWHTHTHARDRTLLEELSTRRRNLYLMTHNTHNRQTSMPTVGFEPTITASERLQNYTLDPAAIGIGAKKRRRKKIGQSEVFLPSLHDRLYSTGAFQYVLWDTRKISPFLPRQSLSWSKQLTQRVKILRSNFAVFNKSTVLRLHLELSTSSGTSLSLLQLHSQL